MKYRSYRGLLGFLDVALVEDILRRNPYRVPNDGQGLRETLWHYRRACDALGGRSLAGLVAPLDACFTDYAEAQAGDPYFQDHYAGRGYAFGTVALDDLITPQFDVDMEYVDELVEAIGPDQASKEIFDFCFAQSWVPDPIVSGNQIVFSSRRRDLDCELAPAIRRISGTCCEIVLQAKSRANFLQVADLGKGQLVLANGVHRALALLRVGVRHVPCLWRSIGDLAELGLDEGGSLYVCRQLLRAPGPALVRDFLDPQLAVPLQLRAMDLVLRVQVGADMFLVPKTG